MENSIFSSALLLVFHFILLSCIHFSFSHCANLGSETDKQALLALKSRISRDPFEALSTWNDSIHFCQWRGVTCSRKHRRVVAVDLRSQNLVGSISPHIGNLTFLKSINLQNNSFQGEIPQEMGRLFRLQFILFSRNYIQGEIQINLTRCSELRILDLVMNKLVGTIPADLGTLSKLIGLGLASNNLTGSIPQSLSNLSSLVELSLSENSLSGTIPVGLGQLKQLEMFQISANMFLTGSIPTQLFNISSLSYFGVSANQFLGEIPSYIGRSLRNLRVLLLGGNKFTGSLPHSISNATELERLDFSFNHFSGQIPVNLGSLKSLVRLNFGSNKLGTGKNDDLTFLDSLVNCTYLEVLGLNNNSLSGVLPNSIANLSSHLSYLAMGANWISGSIPTRINNLENLVLIGMEENLLTGSIPTSIGYLSNLRVLSLFGNKLSGKIPPSLGNATLLIEISLDGNTIQGRIPSSLGNCSLLQRLGLSQNKLSGTIPKQVIGLSSLSEWLDLFQNNLTGPIPTEVGHLRNIRYLDLSDNKLLGKIPSSIENCVSLEYLKLRGNSFQGPIPLSLSSLKGIQDLDLSLNNFSGKIPNFLGTFLFLRKLNLSFNDLEGEVPKEGIFKNASAVGIIGNDKLCGGIQELHLHSCSIIGPKKPWHHLRRLEIIIIVVCAGTGLISMCFTAIFYRRKNVRRKSLVKSPLDDKYLRVSYAQLLKATEGFSSANLVGIGSYGSVYKATLGHEESPVAVKVLDLQQRGASQSFIAECEALRCTKHRNLIKIITSCSSVDFSGNEFKALVFEFMPNGNLEKFLGQQAEEQNQRQFSNLMQRLNIAIDVAHALDYLHHHCHTPIVHCDLKPSNILLDDDLSAHVGDFGLARLLYDKNPQNQTCSSRLKGTIGYVAPEYGMTGEVSIYGDVYSYGIVLLEMFTGRRPTEDMFKDGVSLHNFAKMAIPEQVVEIVDPLLLEEAPCIQVVNNVGEFNMDLRSKIHEGLISILRIGVQCSAELPRERMKMKDVVMELQAIKDLILVGSGT